SYEWLSSLQFQFHYTGYGIYKKIKNPYFDKLVRDIRGRWNSKLLTNRESVIVITKHHTDNILSTYAFIADQSPKAGNIHHLSPFFGHQVPFFTGVERLSKKLNLPVVHLDVRKKKRGFYEATFRILSEQPKTVADFEITDAFARNLEEQIKSAPEYYLWTHKRFKHIDTAK
ncbi:MAG: lysophospholipid acyltransferase family protein, partial [Leeuwenhoekiella sp.]